MFSFTKFWDKFSLFQNTFKTTNESLEVSLFICYCELSQRKDKQMADDKELDTPFQEWVDLYRNGEITPEEFVSEMEFDGFDGDLIEYL